MSRDWQNQHHFENWVEKLEDDTEMLREKLWEFLVVDDERCNQFLWWLDKNKPEVFYGWMESYVNTNVSSEWNEYLGEQFDAEMEKPAWEHD